MRTRRWSDNDHHFGPFTYSRDGSYRPIAVVLSSAEEEYPGCSLRVSGFGHTFIVELPPVIKPHLEKVTAKYWDAATIERMGCDWYYDISKRQYGFSVSDGFLQVFLGRQTDDSSTEQRWSKFLPWTQWRFVRHSFYGLDGSHFWTEQQAKDRELPSILDNLAQARQAEDTCPSVSFEFNDFDGERIIAKTLIEEREWRFGEGWFKWLSLFRRPKISRSLKIDFSSETGRRKGSWKGGTVGHSIEMNPGELHASAFKRYCAEHDMTFVGEAI